MIIRDILNLKGGALFTIAPEARVSEAVDAMVRNDVGSLVVTGDGRMVGLLTFREILRALDSQHGNLGDLRVAKVMVKDSICGAPDDTIDHLRAVMTQNHVRYLPVKEGERLLGIISFHDVARAVIRETSLENRLLKRYIEEEHKG